MKAQFDSLAPSEWLASYGWTPAESLLDPDGDRVPSWMEYVAGTGPDDSNSFTRITGTIEAIADIQFVIEWPSVTGRVYSVTRMTDLSAPPTPVVEQLPATPPINRYTDTVENVEMIFYGIEINMDQP